MFKVALLLALLGSAQACCGLSFTTCCQAYAPPRIIGYERIPLYAKVPVQQAPPPPPATYAVAPAAPPPPPMLPTAPIVVQDPGMSISNYAAPVSQVGQVGPIGQVGQVVGQPVVQSVILQETPVYSAAPSAIAVQEVLSRYPYGSYALSPVGVNSGIVSNNVPGVATNAINAIDYNSPIAVPTAKALKLRRSYLKQVKV